MRTYRRRSGSYPNPRRREHCCEASLVQGQTASSGTGAGAGAGGSQGATTGATAAGITVTLSHITLEDALDIITASNNWTWRKFGDYYAIMSKATANAE